MNYFDLILIIIIVTTLWVGYRRGAISLIAGIAGKILTLLGAWYFAPTLAAWAGPRFGILPWLMKNLEESLPVSKMLGEADMGRVAAQKLPDLLDKLNMPPILKFKMMETVPELVASGSASVVAIVQELAFQGAMMILTAASFIVLLLVGSILLRLIVGIFDLVLGGTFIGFCNRLLGMGLGFLVAAGLIVFIIGITAPWILTSPPGEKEVLVTLLKNSYLYPRLLDFYGVFVGNIISMY